MRRKKKFAHSEKTKFAYWLVVASHTNFKLQVFSRPEKVGGVNVPSTLDELTIGQLMELSKLENSNESFYTICSIILGLNHKQVSKARAVDVVRFVGWVVGQVKKINKLFEETNIEPTQEEKKAGIESLKFGLFGMVDWYAKRMGIQNHDEVLQVPWLRIYKCLDMDNKTALFNRRLNKVYNDEYRQKARGHSN